MEQHRRSRVKTYVPCVLFLAAALVLGGYVCRNFERFRELIDLSVTTVLSLVILAGAFVIVNGSINYFFYRGLGASLTYNESVGLAAVNTLANQLPFAGGLFAKGIYLKQRHRLSYTGFLSATMALYVCFVAVNGAVALAVLGYWALLGSVEAPLPLILGFSGMAASVTSLWLPVDALSLRGKMGKWVSELAEGWRVLRQNVALVAVMAAFQVLMTLLFAGRFWIAFRALSQEVTYSQCLLFSSATVLTRLVNIAPGGLGVREGIVAAVATLLGFEPGVSTVAVALDRLIATSVIIVLGTIYTYFLSAKAANSKEAHSMISEE